jgi:TATA-box binding protein (TBP) (component of TFIID and TFIIIB)
MNDLDRAWESFVSSQTSDSRPSAELPSDLGPAPQCSEIYISTKTKISYLNGPVALANAFWGIPVLDYHVPREGVVKKQMKFNSSSAEDLEALRAHMAREKCVDEHVIERIVNPKGRIKYKDVRKISIGLCKKDITSCRRKKRGAFYNCFVTIMRVGGAHGFREIHVKIFNTGKLEIPGVQDPETLARVLRLVVETLRPLRGVSPHLRCLEDKTETVLINSNFHCGYLVDREKLYGLLRRVYHIDSAYDPCSYPGIQSTFYHDATKTVQTGRQPGDGAGGKHITKVSFMIFRTGSVLIVGKCSEEVLEDIYAFLGDLLRTEYHRIGCPGAPEHCHPTQPRAREPRRKTLTIELRR